MRVEKVRPQHQAKRYTFMIFIRWLVSDLSYRIAAPQASEGCRARTLIIVIHRFCGEPTMAKAMDITVDKDVLLAIV